MTEDDPKEPIEQSDDLARVSRAYSIACMNLAELNDQRTKLTNALEGAIMLIDKLMTEMRLANVVPSGQVIAFKAGFDQGMRELLGRKEEE